MPVAHPAAGGALEDVVRAHIGAVLEQCSGNVSRAAAVLGIARNTLIAQIRKLGLDLHGSRDGAAPEGRAGV